MSSFIETLRFNEQGLIPAIVQDVLDGTVLMMAWMNEASLKKTLETGETWFWSRSRQELWHKGATSGHIQRVESVRYDCDEDVLLVTVEQVGAIACHLNERSCFHRLDGLKSLPPADMLSQVYRVIQERKETASEKSYTSQLLAAGDNKILKKVGEESAEVIMASKDGIPERIAEEVADLWYHTLVLLAHHDMDILDVYQVLKKRRK
jgi:phosphoribosyl-AMP cyclohydrolase / phosphoribosyl-ATP pyrophosphohydrolase